MKITIDELKVQDHADGEIDAAVKCVEVDFKKVGCQVIVVYRLPKEALALPNMEGAIDAGDVHIESNIVVTYKTKYQNKVKRQFTLKKTETWRLGPGGAALRKDQITHALPFGWNPDDACSTSLAASVSLRVKLLRKKNDKPMRDFQLVRYSYQEEDPDSGKPIDGPADNGNQKAGIPATASSENGSEVDGDKWDLLDGISPKDRSVPDWGPLGAAIEKNFPDPTTKDWGVGNDHCGKPIVIIIFGHRLTFPPNFEFKVFKRIHDLSGPSGSGESAPAGGSGGRKQEILLPVNHVEGMRPIGEGSPRLEPIAQASMAKLAGGERTGKNGFPSATEGSPLNRSGEMGDANDQV